MAHLGRLRNLWLTDMAPGIDLAPLAGSSQLIVHVLAGQDVRNGHLLGRRLKRIKV
ncbi:hypothetical protein [Nonomuraea sp. LPB2021202275-12-8]|uniref:hypothetical protein n=1 Tax=Nonomuraea sp. LPB2021202275-12-8 TaxID=3120159 RepID=UPI00300CBC46